MTERIIIEIDDTQLDEAMAKLNTAILSYQTTIGARDTTSTRKQMSAFADFMRLSSQEIAGTEQSLLEAFGTADLPAINRELRLVTGQIPGVRNVISAYFRLKRIQRSVGVAIEADPALRAVLLHPDMVLTILATAILITRALWDIYTRNKQREREYAEFVRREKGWTRAEFDRYMGKQRSYIRSIPG